jgi:hypothetical protein
MSCSGVVLVLVWFTELMSTVGDQAVGGFSVSSGGGARRWTADDMRRAVPAPTPMPPGQAAVDDELTDPMALRRDEPAGVLPSAAGAGMHCGEVLGEMGGVSANEAEQR